MEIIAKRGKEVISIKSSKRKFKWLIIQHLYNCLIGKRGGLQGPCRWLQFLQEKKNVDIHLLLIVPKNFNLEHLQLQYFNKKKLIVIYSESFNSLRTWKKIYSYLKQEGGKYDINYTYGYYTIPVFYALKKKKLIISRFLGTFLYQCLKLKNFKCLNVKRFIEFYAIKKAQYVVMTNDGTEGDKLLNFLGFERNKSYLFLVNGIDKEVVKEVYSLNKENLKQFFGKKYFNNPDFLKKKEIFTQISRLAPWKRVDLSIKCFYYLLKNLPPNERKNKIMLIIGSGKDEGKLKNMVRRLNLTNNIFFLGNVDWKTTLKFQHISDFLTSFYAISCVGNVMLEGLSLGKIFFAWNSGATKDFIKHLETGILLPYEEKNDNKVCEAFTENYLLLKKNPVLRRQIELNALKFADENIPSWEERLNIEYNWILNKTKEQL